MGTYCNIRKTPSRATVTLRLDSKQVSISRCYHTVILYMDWDFITWGLSLKSYCANFITTCAYGFIPGGFITAGSLVTCIYRELPLSVCYRGI